MLVGLPVRRLWSISWMMATTSACLGAILVLPEVGLRPAALTFIVLPPLAAALAARFRSAPIAMVAALALGLADGLLQWQSSLDHTWLIGATDLGGYRGVLPLLLVLAALLLSGGRGAIERV